MINTYVSSALLPGVHHKEISNFLVGGSNLTGTWQLLFYYPRDFTFVCPTELVELSNKIEEFESLNTTAYAISSDSEYCHLGWVNSDRRLENLKMPLIADPNFKLSIDRSVSEMTINTYERGTIILDPKGYIKYYCAHEEKVGRNIDEILRVLKALQTNKLTPCNWSPGDKTID